MAIDNNSSGQSVAHQETAELPHRIVGGGEMGDLVRAKDWSTTPLGAVEQWSETLLSYVNLLLSSPLPATLSWGEELTFLSNDAAIPTLGERHPDALGRSYREVFADAWHLVGKDIEECFRLGLSPIRENVHIPLKRNGSTEDGYYTYALVPVYERGRIVGVYNPYQNTTQAIVAERERAKQEERLQLALSAANGVGIWDWDIPRDLVFTDSEFATLYGVDPVDGARGVSISAFTAHIHKEDFERVAHEISAAVRGGSEFASEYRLVLPGGLVRWVFAKGRCYRDEQGRAVRFPGVTLDITARKAMEEELNEGADRLRRNEEKFRTFVEAVSDVVYRVSADWSEALEVEGRGFLPDTHAPDPEWFTRNVHPDDQGRVLEAIQKSVREGVVFAMEHKVQRLDGNEGWTFSRAIPVRDEHGTVVEWFGAASDITARKQAEHALLRSEKLAAVGRLASSIAHEINNPLEAVTNLHYLIGTTTLPPDAADYLQQAQAELARISQITMETLRFSRRNTRASVTKVSDLVESVLNLHDGKIKQALVTVVRRYEDHQPLHCFPNELRQVIANLIGNAIDAMIGYSDARLCLRVRYAHDARTGDAGVRLTVADTGAGMTRATMERL